MRLLRRIMVYSLIVIIPVLIICLSANIALRAPDVYQYSLKATEVLDQQNIDADDDAMGDFFSGYMLHKVPEFQMEQGLEGEEELIFSKNDQLAMESLRKVLDITAIVAILFLVFSLVSCIYLIRADYKDAMRWTFKRAAILMAILIAASIVLYNLSFTGTFIHQHIFKTVFEETDMLPLIMSGAYSKTLLIVTDAICAVVTAISGYVIWSLTKPKRMFF